MNPTTTAYLDGHPVRAAHRIEHYGDVRLTGMAAVDRGEHVRDTDLRARHVVVPVERVTVQAVTA